MRVLLIESNKWLAEQLRSNLGADDYQVHHADLGEDGINLARHYEYDAIIVGTPMPDLTGVMAVKRLRLAKVLAPILVLANETDTSLRVAVLDQGADDCLSRPFHKAEFCARVRALIRRAYAHPYPVIRNGNLEVDLEVREARVCGTPIGLTATEYRMLELLALRKGSTIPREAIFDSLYDGRDDPEQKVIDVFICKIRKKIAALNRGESYIATAWGTGYRLREPAATAA